MYNIIQPGTRINLLHLTRPKMKEIKNEGGGPDLQIIVPPTEKYNSVKTNSKV